MKKRRIICVLLSAVLFVTATCPALAAAPAVSTAESTIRPMYTFIAYLAAGLDIDSNGLAACGGSVFLSNAAYTCSMTIKLQRYSSGWTTRSTWTYSGEDDIDELEYYYVTSGYSYRVVVTVSVYNQNGTLVETQSLNSATRTY